MFKLIHLYFKDRSRYESRKRYIKLQKEYRKKLKKQAEEFCPWSGYYMHEVVVTMLEFYYKTYEAKDCCWTESACNGTVAKSLKEALDYAEKLDKLDAMNCLDITPLAEEYLEEFNAYCDKLDDSTYVEKYKDWIAYEFLEKKYTSELYNIIGKHIWEWCD